MTKKVVAIPCDSDKGLNSMVVSRFGRCPYFTIVCLDGDCIDEVTIVQNPGIDAMGGAGPLAVQTISKENANVIEGSL